MHNFYSFLFIISFIEIFQKLLPNKLIFNHFFKKKLRFGPDHLQPILMIHAWQDNAGSFDPLLPMLPQHFSYLAIDLPGHGLSSHLPSGCFYHVQDFIFLLEIIRQNFKLSRLSLVSHSIGAVMSFNYAWLFPERVRLVCALDVLKTFSFGATIESDFFELHTRKLLTLDESKIKNPPDYTYNEMIQHIHENTKKSINKDKAKYIIERGTKPSTTNPNRLRFSRDIRVKYIQFMFADHKKTLQYIKRIQAPYLFIRGDDRNFSEPESLISETIDEFRRQNEQFEMFKVDGTHHFHLNTPELIADKVSEFLQKHHVNDEKTA